MSGLFSRLKDFSVPEAVAAPAIPSFEHSMPLFDEPGEPPVDVEAERQEAYERGRTDAAAELSERYEEEARTVALLHEREVEELRRRYDEDFALAIREGLESIAAQIAHLVSNQTAAAIAPILTETLAENAVHALADLLRETIAQGGVASVTVHGPKHLFELLLQEMGEGSQLLRHQETDDIDLTAEIDDSVLVTRLSAWATGLRKVME